MPRVRVHHIALRTRRLAKVVAFYRRVLGLETLRVQKLQSGRIKSVWLEAGDAIVMIEAAERGEPVVSRGLLELVCFAAGSKAERERVRRKVRIEGETAHTIYFRDPDGRRVGVSSYVSPYATKRT
jgi:catechol 2,3-dioxygenase-like lactoylglutathione lyase family enzyme